MWTQGGWYDAICNYWNPSSIISHIIQKFQNPRGLFVCVIRFLFHLLKHFGGLSILLATLRYKMLCEVAISWPHNDGMEK